ncbi:hypothetical protein Hypma_005422 [Hypsizygus marmoreus]|uniref:Uncharacterized protein n=1 Tax=Hypsizygus marmoreus TaxID=39966 RepID=A0A369IZB9_HYPMA|nr:hypothetical protein Hypma_005422 [Hypsizygus marmoreus]
MPNIPPTQISPSHPKSLSPQDRRVSPLTPPDRCFHFPPSNASPPRPVPPSPLNALPFQSARRLSGDRKDSTLSKTNTITNDNLNNPTIRTNCL